MCVFRLCTDLEKGDKGCLQKIGEKKVRRAGDII